MSETFDAHQFLNHLRTRWRLAAIACSVAITLALVVSLLATKQYTATSRIMIDPPAGSDPRGTLVVSPVYLEALRTFEHLATSDSMFAQALDRFHLRELTPGRPVEAWKRRILEVSIPRNTRILEISATLPDPKTAQELAQFLAEETIRLNRDVSREGDEELTRQAEAQLAVEKAERDQAEAAWRDINSREPLNALSAELAALETRRFRLERDLVDTGTRIADGTLGNQAAASLQARAQHLQAQLRALSHAYESTSFLHAARTVRRQQAETRLRRAETAYEAAERRVREALGSAGYRAERLRLIDRGIVPERPSSPNTPLNLMAALAFALVLSLSYLSFEFALRRKPRAAAPLMVKAMGKGGGVD